MEETVIKPSLGQRFKSFLVECRRVWQITKKPTKEELIMTIKVTGIGLLIIGFIGFVINMLWQLFLQ